MFALMKDNLRIVEGALFASLRFSLHSPLITWLCLSPCFTFNHGVVFGEVKNMEHCDTNISTLGVHIKNQFAALRCGWNTVIHTITVEHSTYTNRLFGTNVVKHGLNLALDIRSMKIPVIGGCVCTSGGLHIFVASGSLQHTVTWVSTETNILVWNYGTVNFCLKARAHLRVPYVICKTTVKSPHARMRPPGLLHEHVLQYLWKFSLKFKSIVISYIHGLYLSVD